MTSQEARSKWQIIRRADFAGSLAACKRCGSLPQLYVVDGAGLYIKTLLPWETFYAVRCACGNTGEMKLTGKNVMGNYIDAQRAADLAAEAWNAEQV